ncbi:MAG: YitT family protein [Desulfocapsaceae bacterium]|nr:YitT family protein [Desulfocapsaceae bacterium]
MKLNGLALSKLKDIPKKRHYRYSVPWNLLLLSLGSIIFMAGINGVVVHHNFIPGGLYGTCLLIFYKTELLSPGMIYFLLNIPLCVLGWFLVSKRFVLYSVYTAVLVTILSELLIIDFGIDEQIYAAIAGGFLCGAGSGIILRSIGSSGGLDIAAIIVNKYFNVGVGKFFMAYNCVLFSIVFAGYSPDIFVASILLVFVSSKALDYFLTFFNQRKVVYVISDIGEAIGEVVTNKMHMGATFIQGRGAYSGKDKPILMTVTNNIQLKKLEEMVFTLDEHAVFIVENSFDVIGSNFRKRKIY